MPPQTCPVCHQPTLPQYYFCPNCGTNLRPAPLDTDTGAQVSLYTWSIVMPFLCFLFISKWKGITYYKNSDPKAKQMGTIAWILIVLSTIVTLYYAYVFTEDAIQSSVASINADMSAN